MVLVVVEDHQLILAKFKDYQVPNIWLDNYLGNCCNLQSFHHLDKPDGTEEDRCCNSSGAMENSLFSRKLVY